MPVSPLLDFFKRGEVARDVRLMAAAGALAPRAHEQLELLVLLQADADPEVRRVADATLARVPLSALRRFLGRSDTSLGMREHFGDLGIFPDDSAESVDPDAPLVALESEVRATDSQDTDDTDDPSLLEEPVDEQARLSIVQRLSVMKFPEKLKAALKGSREVRAILVRDPNKMIAAAVLSSPKLTESEVESIAKMASVSDDVLRVIASNRSWVKNYQVVVGLTRNPKTPVGLSLNLMNRLIDRDLQRLAIDRNVPEPLRIAARRRVIGDR